MKTPEERRQYHRDWCARNREKCAAYRRAYYSKNAMAVKTRTAQWQLDNPDARRTIKRRWDYGSTGEDLWTAQGGRCGICDVDLLTKPPRLRHLDHCHATGAVRGWLCHKCNTGLGKLGDNEAGLLKALGYINRKFSTTRK